MKSLVFALLTVAVMGCSSHAVPEKTVPEEAVPEEAVPTEPPPPPDTDKCALAEANLEKLQCMDSHGDPMWVNKRGERFAETCRKAQEEALIFLDPACIAEATTCEGANECPATGH